MDKGTGGHQRAYGGDKDERLTPPNTFIEMFAGIGGFRLGLESLGLRCVWANDIDPAACAVYRRRHGEIAEGSIEEIPSGEIPDHDMLTAGFPCFATGTLVLAEDGGYVPIETVSVGDRVLTHRGRWRRVMATMKRGGAKLRRIKAQGVDVVTTDEHPFYARHRKYERVRKFAMPGWVRASELTRNHYVSQVLPPVKKSGHTEEFWWLVGRYLADGWRVRRKGRVNAGRTVICCAHAEADELRERIILAGFHATPVHERTAVKFHITVNSLYRFLEPFGHLAHGKTLPGFALSLSAKKSAALMDGYMSGDGTDYGSGRQATTVSQRLAFGMALLAQRIGRVASIRSHHPASRKYIEGRSVNQRDMWLVSVADRNRSGFIEGGLAWKLVRRNDRCGTGTVYNIAVDGDESYVANGAVVHNCQSFSRAGANLGFNDTRGTLFFEVARVLRDKRPKVAVLENVRDLLSHDKGRTFRTVATTLRECGYSFDFAVLNSADFGVAQRRERVYIICSLGATCSLSPPLPQARRTLATVHPHRRIVIPPAVESAVRKKLSERPESLVRIRDVRTGFQSIPTWTVGLFGKVSHKDAIALETMRRGHQAVMWDAMAGKDKPGRTWIRTFRPRDVGSDRRRMERLADMGYIRRKEGGYSLINRNILPGGLPAVYGGPAATAPTLTASNMNHFGLVLEDGVYALGATEFEAIQGFPPGFTDIGGLTDRKRMKLLGNAVTPQVVRHAAGSLLSAVG